MIVDKVGQKFVEWCVRWTNKRKHFPGLMRVMVPWHRRRSRLNASGVLVLRESSITSGRIRILVLEEKSEIQAFVLVQLMRTLKEISLLGQDRTSVRQ